MLSKRLYSVNSIKNIIHKFITPEPKKVVGRWKIHDNTKHAYILVDYSNEDHCGSCSQYRLDKIKINSDEETKDSVDKKLDNYNYEYHLISVNTQN